MMRSIKAFIKMTVERSQALEVHVNVTEADAQIFGGKSANKIANIIDNNKRLRLVFTPINVQKCLKRMN